MPTSYGLVIEGSYDQVIYPKLLEKIRGRALPTYTRPCYGVEELKRSFPGLLRELEGAHHDNPVDKALVIRDADSKIRQL